MSLVRGGVQTHFTVMAVLDAATARMALAWWAQRGALNIDRAVPWSAIYDPRYLPPATDLRQA